MSEKQLINFSELDMGRPDDDKCDMWCRCTSCICVLNGWIEHHESGEPHFEYCECHECWLVFHRTGCDCNYCTYFASISLSPAGRNYTARQLLFLWENNLPMRFTPVGVLGSLVSNDEWLE